jgi:hypothetical protein
MFKEDAEYIVAGEIIRTARMYASSVSPLSKKLLENIAEGSFAGDILKQLGISKAASKRLAQNKPARHGEHHGDRHVDHPSDRRRKRPRDSRRERKHGGRKK